MAPAAPADPVKLLAALLWREPGPLGEALARLGERFGAVDCRGDDHPFAGTDYYQAEMGSGLQRTLVSFGPLVAPESLLEAKLSAVAIEDALRGPAGRRVNIDPGYLDLHKLVLASLKSGAMKVHLGKGVYADLVCRYSEGQFHPLEWTFLDFRQGLYERDLLEIRARYRAALPAARGLQSSPWTRSS